MGPRRMVWRWWTALVVLTGVWGAAVPAVADLWWNDASGIGRSANNGANRRGLVPTITSLGLAIDPAADRMYWTDTLLSGPLGERGRIYGSGLDGFNPVAIITGLADPAALALDRAAGKLYWTDNTTHSLHVVNTDGTGSRQIATNAIWTSLDGLAVDPVAGKLYFSYDNPLLDGLRTSSIGRINLDGAGFENVASGLVDPHGVALDLANQQVYFADPEFNFLGKIRRAKFDGSVVEDVVTGLRQPYGVTLDTAAQMLYWTDDVEGALEGGRVQRRAVSGGSVGTLVSQLTAVNSIAVTTVVPGDANGDGVVNRTDLWITADHLGKSTAATWADGDFNQDGRVTVRDIRIVHANFTPPGSPSASGAVAVPEPTTAALAAIVLLGTLVRIARRRGTH